jgi:hypothetical protein
MKIIPEIRVGDLISTCSFLIASVGLFLNLWQLRIGGIRKRAEFIVSVFNQYVTDPDTSRTFYDIEYGRFRYDRAKFHGSEQERHLDRLLSYFEKIAVLYDMGTITLRDLEIVRYDFVRVFHNADVQEYFQTLDSLPEALGVEGATFSRYRNLAALLDSRRKNA